MQINYQEGLTSEDQQTIQEWFEYINNRFGHVVLARNPNAQIGDMVIINWACIWNKPHSIGKRAIVGAMTDKFSLVQIENTQDFECVRHEDITLIK